MTNDSTARTGLQEGEVSPRVQSDEGLTIPDYRQAYGLSQDPFDPDLRQPFFTGAQRRELLDQLLHLCQFGSGVTLLVADQGVGKTQMAFALRDALGHAQVCYLPALPTFDESSLIQILAEYFDLEAKDSLLQMMETLADRTQDIEDDSNVLLVDDADHLADEVLLALFERPGSDAEDNPGLKVVLIGTPTLLDRIHGLLSGGGVVNEVYLEPFTLTEAVDYLNFRMEMADYLGAELFTEANTEVWWRQSQGSLPRLHRYAREYLFHAAVQPESFVTRKSFPVAHVLAVAALVSLAATIWLYREDEPDDSPFVDIGLSPRIQEPPLIDSPENSQSLQAERSVETEAARSDRASSSLMQAPLPIVSLESTEEIKQHESEIRAEGLQVAASSQPSAQATASAKKPLVEVAEASDVPAAPAAAPAPVAERTRSLSVDEQTLLSWNQTDYTLQLLGVSTEKAALDYILAQPNRDDLLMFKTVRQGKSWFVVVAGRFDSSASARAAIGNLPAHQSEAGAWARGLSGIQADIQK